MSPSTGFCRGVSSVLLLTLGLVWMPGTVSAASGGPERDSGPAQNYSKSDGYHEDGRCVFYHEVKLGESLTAIAEKYEVDLEVLAEDNDIDDSNLIVENQTLCIMAHAAGEDRHDGGYQKDGYGGYDNGYGDQGKGGGYEKDGYGGYDNGNGDRGYGGGYEKDGYGGYDNGNGDRGYGGGYEKSGYDNGYDNGNGDRGNGGYEMNGYGGYDNGNGDRGYGGGYEKNGYGGYDNGNGDRGYEKDGYGGYGNNNGDRGYEKDSYGGYDNGNGDRGYGGGYGKDGYGGNDNGYGRQENHYDNQGHGNPNDLQPGQSQWSD
jgi:hypothetical protein